MWKLDSRGGRGRGVTGGGRYLGRKGISPPEVTISDRERFRRSAVRIHHRVDPSSCRTGLTGNHFCRWLLLENTDWKQGFVPFHWRNSAVWIFGSFFFFFSFYFLSSSLFPEQVLQRFETLCVSVVVGVRNCSIWTIWLDMKRLITGSILVRLSKSRFNGFPTCLRVVSLRPCSLFVVGKLFLFSPFFSLFLFFFQRDKINVLIIKLIVSDYLSLPYGIK